MGKTGTRYTEQGVFDYKCPSCDEDVVSWFDGLRMRISGCDCGWGKAVSASGRTVVVEAAEAAEAAEDCDRTADKPERVSGYRLLQNLTANGVEKLKSKLTLTSRPFGSNAPVKVECFAESNREGELCVPRYYRNTFIPDVSEDISKSYSFMIKVDLLESRGQPSAVTAMTSHLKNQGAGILQAYTGCGKTILGYVVAAQFRSYIGVFVYNEHMLENWVEAAQLVFGLDREDIGIVQGSRCDLGKPVTIMMVQSLYSTQEYPKELYNQFGCIVADEVNRYGASVWQTIVNKFPALYRLGLSAHPSRKDGLDDVIYWNFNNVSHVVTKGKKLAKPSVVQVEWRADYNERSYASWSGGSPGEPNHQKYCKVISRDSARVDFIVKQLVSCAQKGRKFLVFSNRRDHTINLFLKFQACQEGSSSLLISKVKKKGEPSGLVIDDVRDALQSDYIFTTYSMARDALNVPQIDTLVFAEPTGDLLQPVGRLRDKGPEDRKPLMILDLYETDPYSEGKARRRREFYASKGLKLDSYRASISGISKVRG